MPSEYAEPLAQASEYGESASDPDPSSPVSEAEAGEPSPVPSSPSPAVTTPAPKPSDPGKKATHAAPGTSPSASAAKVISSGTCPASYYEDEQKTASGERFNPDGLTAAHRSLPMNSMVRVTNPRTGESVLVRINDRGPYAGNRCLGLSRAAFDAIGDLSAGELDVDYDVLGD